nr:VWA domain-containing protein [Pirellula sp.]
MNESQNAYLSFSNSPGLLAASIVVLLAAFGIGYWNSYCSQWRRAVVLLEIMRFAIVAAIVILFNQPEWTQEFRPSEKPRLVVLVDDSQSMETRDVLPPGVTAKVEAQTRREAAAQFIEPKTWSELNTNYDVRIEPFSGGENTIGGTDIHASLESVLESSQRTAAVVLVSDGDWNRGKPPVESAIRYRSRGVPIFTIPIGSTIRLPDLEVLSLDIPTFAISGKSVRIPFTIESTLSRDHVATVVIEIADGERLTKEVKLSAKSKTTESVVWMPKTTGDFTVKMSLPNHPEEVIFTNNEITAPISIREEKLKVLVIDSLPRWEYRYLRNALSRDPGVDVSCLLFHPTLGRTGGGTKDYIKDFPDQIEQLAEYDVVFLGDVGIESGQLTPEQC